MRGPLQYDILKFFHITFLPIVKILVVKNFEGSIGGGFPNSGT